MAGDLPGLLVLEPVDVVQRNFDAIAQSFVALHQRVQLLERSQSVSGGTLDVESNMSALYRRCNTLEKDNEALMARVTLLEGELLGSNKNTNGGKEGEKVTGGGESLLERLRTVEAAVTAACERSTAFATKTHASFGDVWSEIHLMQRRLTDLPRGDAYVTTEAFAAFSRQVVNQHSITADRCDRLTHTTDDHARRLRELELSVAGLLKDTPRGDELKKILDRLAQALQATDSRVEGLSVSQMATEAAVDELRELADVARAGLDAQRERLGDLEQLTTNRVDRLASSTAKSLRALEIAIDDLRRLIESNVVSGRGDDWGPLIQKRKVPCLSCDPSTAAELRPDALRHRPAAPNQQQGGSVSRTVRPARTKGANHHVLPADDTFAITPASSVLGPY
jgi:predicted transcriptional regulator